MLKKWTIFCLIILFFFSYLPAPSVHAAKLIPLDEVIKAGIEHDADLKDLHENLNKKQIELTQAIQAVQDQAERDASLIAKPHSLSKDLDLTMKIPNARSGYKSAIEELKSKERTVTFNMTKLYTKTYQSMLSIPKVQFKLDKAKKALNDTKTKLKFGLQTKQDVEAAQKEWEQVNSELKLAQLDFKNSKIELGERIGQSLEKDDFTFEVKPTYAKLSQSFIWRLIHLSDKNDFDLFNDVNNRKLAEEKDNSTRNLYAAKFGVNEMTSINTLYNTQTIDPDLLNSNYDALLETIKKQWEGIFLFPLPFIPYLLPIPKTTLQGEYDGLRYFDDIKYSLPVSTLDLNKARAKEADTRKNLVLKIKKSYLDTKTVEENYAQALKTAEAAKAALKTADKTFKTGIMSKDDYAKSQEAVNDADQNVLNNQIIYQAGLAQLNLDTSGALAPYIVPGILPWKDIESGLDPLNKVPPVSNPIVGSWNLKAVAGTMTADFSLKIDSKLKATHYALMTEDGQIIGSKQKLKGKIRHLQFIYNDPSALKVVLYKKNDIISEASIDGFGSKGALLKAENSIIASPAPKTDVKPKAGDKDNGTLIIGTYKIKKEKLTKANLLAAQATMKKSGQGMYYKSELADGAWINIDKAADINSIGKTKQAKTVPNDEIDHMKLTVSINDEGKISSLQTVADLQVDLESLKKDKDRLGEDNKTAIAANKPEEAASISLQLKDIDAQIAFTDALISGNTTLASAEMAKMNDPNAVLSALPSNSAEANAAAKSDMASDKDKLLVSLDKAKADGNQSLVDQLQAQIAAITANLAQLQQKIDSAQQANLQASQAADTALTQLNTDLVKLQNDLKLAQNPSNPTLVKQLEQQITDIKVKIADAQTKSDAAKLAVKQDTDANNGIAEPIQQPSDDEKITALENQQNQLQKQLQQANEQGQTELANTLQEKSSELDMQMAEIDSGISLQLAVFNETKQSLQKSLDEQVKKGDLSAIDELKKLIQQNDTALQLAMKSMLILDKQIFEDKQQELQDSNSSNPLIENKINDLTLLLIQNEKSKYSEEQLQQLQKASVDIQAKSDHKIQVLPVENLITDGMNIPLEIPPVIMDGTTYIHIRPISEGFKSSVVWDDTDQTVTITNDETTIICQIGNPIASVNGNDVKLDAVPQLIEHHTMVPLRFIVESLGLNIDWHELTKTIEISGT
ncbi:MAG: outer membrane protein TolC [Bacilli bacterium]|nr:outer membrane protein TolC [Bacilli bacterium]